MLTLLYLYDKVHCNRIYIYIVLFEHYNTICYHTILPIKLKGLNQNVEHSNYTQGIIIITIIITRGNSRKITS